MTNETAKREIESLDYYLQNHTDDYSEESHTAMMMAIKALEQENILEKMKAEIFEEILSHSGTGEEVTQAYANGLKEGFIKGYDYGVKDWFEKRTKAQPCIEDYPTCTECEHYDRDKHYCPRFCQVIKDTLAEAQPTDADCISRESLRRKLQEHHDFFVNAFGGFKNMNYIDKARVDKINDCIAMVVNEPSITPQRPKGKWKRIAGFKDCNYNKCSVCGVYQLFYYGKPSTNYCPNCGAEMNKSGGGEDEET